MEASLFDETGFFAALGDATVRYVLIGRQACIAYGLPVVTADYDIAVARESLDALLDVAARYGLRPSVTREQLAEVGHFHLENDERVDVFCARSYPVPGGRLTFEELWDRRKSIPLREGASFVSVPHIRDLIAIKLTNPRKKDIEDARLLQVLAKERGE